MSRSLEEELLSIIEKSTEDLKAKIIKCSQRHYARAFKEGAQSVKASHSERSERSASVRRGSGAPRGRPRGSTSAASSRRTETESESSYSD